MLFLFFKQNRYLPKDYPNTLSKSIMSDYKSTTKKMGEEDKSLHTTPLTMNATQ